MRVARVDDLSTQSTLNLCGSLDFSATCQILCRLGNACDLDVRHLGEHAAVLLKLLRVRVGHECSTYVCTVFRNGRP